MKLTVPTSGVPLTIRMKVKALYPMEIAFVGYDASKRDTVYFKRAKGSPQRPFTEEIIEFALPQSPNVLTIKIFDVAKPHITNNIEVSEVQVGKIGGQTIVYPNERVADFVSFAQRFVEKAGYLRCRRYTSGKPYNFIVDYLKDIRAHETTQAYKRGERINTPARISRVTGRMEINAKEFRQYTLPIRMFVMLHERMHFEYNTRSEFEADAFALKIYLELGYPKTEAVYALTNVLHGNSFDQKRVEQMMSIIYKNGGGRS